MKWFLAHTKAEDDEIIDGWAKRLGQILSAPGRVVEVVPGRDDYSERARALGGWMSWCRDVPCGCDFRGVPRFGGVIVPADLDNPVIGRATASLLRGFIDEGKQVFAWDKGQTFKKILSVTETGQDNWQGWARLTLAKE
jgi:hypothetical protein